MTPRTKLNKSSTVKSKKNAFGLSGKSHQAPVNNIHKTPNSTANKIPLLINMAALCGCYTWKHELSTPECFPIAEQELADNLGYTSLDLDDVVERDWLCGKPVGRRL